MQGTACTSSALEETRRLLTQAYTERLEAIGSTQTLVALGFKKSQSLNRQNPVRISTRFSGSIATDIPHGPPDTFSYSSAYAQLDAVPSRGDLSLSQAPVLLSSHECVHASFPKPQGVVEEVYATLTALEDATVASPSFANPGESNTQSYDPEGSVPGEVSCSILRSGPGDSLQASVMQARALTPITTIPSPWTEQKQAATHSLGWAGVTKPSGSFRSRSAEHDGDCSILSAHSSRSSLRSSSRIENDPIGSEVFSAIID
ncbi:hypothetical protein GMRT_22538 [Giardia muris]|uniref:Uncharacterized protein n=1 Tax=Giardia muris TaxID=5742 RepID=A0A4Z1SSI6_GIAMU|nr:hypothetical protein GMRT_22538 [Giardia muris]|eukprot:TNJ28876.1 hypothetical protein GMRT_22538 [Giardia muris]